MKTLLVAGSLALASAAPMQAEMFRPSTTAGAVIGAVAGGLIGGHNGDRWAEGLVIGAVAGGLIGSAAAPQQPAYRTPPPVVYGQSGGVVYAPAPVQNAPTVPDAPTIYSAPMVAPQPAPQVVYAPAASQVVYVPAPAPVVYVERRPVISLGFGYRSGPVYHHHPRVYHHHHGYHGHRGHHRRH